MPPTEETKTEATEEKPTTEETTSTEQTPEGEEKPNEEAKPTEEEAEETGKEETKLSHEDALEALSKTRTEAASWRTRYRELEKRLEGAKTEEDIEAVRIDMRAENHTLMVENVALHNKLPDEMVAILKDASEGKTREQIEAHAKALAKFVPAEDPEPEGDGGLNPGGDSDGAFDPVAASRAARGSRRF